MSRGEQDKDYRPKSRVSAQKRSSRRIRQAEPVDYSGAETETSSETTLRGSESDSDLEVQQEPGVSQTEIKREQTERWSPCTLSNFTTDLVYQLQNRTRIEMARETENSAMEQLMKMMLSMKQNDQDREERRERDRVEREVKREEQEAERLRQMEERHAQLLVQLKEAQPVVPQRITINKDELPKMTQKDDLDVFITLLEDALEDAEIPRDRWKKYIHSQLTTQAKQRVKYLLKDHTKMYDEIREALMGCESMSFASSAEAVFGSYEGQKPEPRQLGDKATRWVERHLWMLRHYRRQQKRLQWLT